MKMKTLTLELKNKVLIREYKDIDECRMIKSLRGLMPSNDQKLLCKGSELTEEICETLISKKDVAKNQSKICGLDFKKGFINMIEAQGYYWGENPIKKPRVIEYDAFNPLMMESHDKNVKKYKEAESKTFNPEKTLIFEII